jgi:hypothetical protein
MKDEAGTKRSVDDLESLQQMGQLFLIGRVVRLPLEALLRASGSYLRALVLKPVVDALQRSGYDG